jgi:hypothetical protein
LKKTSLALRKNTESKRAFFKKLFIKQHSHMNKNIINIIIAIVITGSASFYGGMQYTQSKTVSPQNFANMTQEERQALRGQFGNGTGARGARMGNGGANGEIISKDDASITIKLRDGGSKIVFLSNTTPVSKTASGTPADLIVGAQVNAVGTANSDGSMTAQSVQIRPISSDTPNRAEAPSQQ